MSSAVTANARRASRLSAKRKSRQVVPSRRRPPGPAPGDPLRLDPSRTGALRVAAGKAVRDRYARLRTELYRLVVLEDALGLAEPPDWFVGNAVDVLGYCPVCGEDSDTEFCHKCGKVTTNDKGQPRDARGRWARVGGHALGALQRAGARAEHLEHAIKHYVTDRLEAGVRRLPAHLQGPVRATVHAGKAVTRAAFVTWTAGQALAERAAVERGMDADGARRLRGVLSALDVATFKPVSVALLASGVGASAAGALSFIPPASAAYLAWSTARDPAATWRAARGLARDAWARVRGRPVTVNAAADVVRDLANYLTARPGDWPFAVLLACVEESGDARAGLQLAREVMRGRPTRNEDADFEPDYRAAVTENALGDSLRAFGERLRRVATELWTGLEETVRGITDLAIRRGAGRSFDETRAGHFLDPNFRPAARDQFLHGVFGSRDNRDRFDALRKRGADEVANHKDAVVERVERVVNDGVLKEQTPAALWKEISTTIDRERDSAVTTVTDEVVRGHAEGQVAGFDEAGVADLYPLMEWTVHPDASKTGVCPRCSAMRGTVWTISDARGKIPLHRNCRCSWTARPHPGLTRRERLRQVPTLYAPGAGARFKGNVFCPTGPGGGVNPTCSPGGSGGHVIDERDVAAWLADSVNKEVSYHATSREGAASILSGGVSVEKSTAGALIFGQGFYTSTSAEDAAAQANVPTVAVVKVAVKMKNPLDLTRNPAGWGMLAELSEGGGFTSDTQKTIRRNLLKRGYDGVIMPGTSGATVILAIRDDQVKVIRPGAAENAEADGGGCGTGAGGFKPGNTCAHGGVGGATSELSPAAEEYRKVAWLNAGAGRKPADQLPPAKLAKLVRSYAGKVQVAERAGRHDVARELAEAAPRLLPRTRTLSHAGAVEPYDGGRHEGAVAGHAGPVRVVRPGIEFDHPPRKGLLGGGAGWAVVVRARVEVA